MTQTDPRTDSFDTLVLDAAALNKAGINAVRVSLGILGFAGLGLGIALLVWPGKSLMVVAAIAAIFFVIGGIARTAFGIFGRDIAGGARILNLILGLILAFAGVVTLKNLDASTAVLTIITVVMIGIGWIIEGIATLVSAGRARSAGLAIFQGVVGIIAGIVVIAVPGWSALWLVIFTGVLFTILGLVSLVRAFTFGRGATPAVVDA